MIFTICDTMMIALFVGIDEKKTAFIGKPEISKTYLVNIAHKSTIKVICLILA
jgi:hypothetical protein